MASSSVIFILLGAGLGAASPRATPLLTRRAALSGICAAGCPPAVHAATGSITGQSGRKCQTLSNPAVTVVTCLGFGLQSDGRLAGCAADEACIASSAVNNPSKFAPPWAPSGSSPESTDAPRAWRSLIAAVQDQSDLSIVERDDERYYVRAQAPSVVNGLDCVDDVEFLLRVDGAESAPRALFRSATRQSVFVYPLQQPVNNQKSHFQRLEAIRLRLGWENQGLSSDAALEKDMDGQRLGNFFGFLGGVKVPDYEDY